MGDGAADFRAYMIARWPALVRSLVLMGCDPGTAEDVAEDALARCYSSWDRVRRADDVDTYVYGVLLERWDKTADRASGNRPVASGAVVPLLDTGLSDPTPRLELLRALEEALDPLPEDLRLVLVLRFVADLDVVQVAEILGLPVATVETRQAEALARVDLGALWEESR